FMLTYGDAVSDINIKDLLKFHESHGKICTISMVSIAQQKGVLDVASDGRIQSFREKADEDGALINGGFMVMNPQIFDYLDGDDTVLEQSPMRKLVAKGELMGYHHTGFWQCMDTQREKQKLDKLWGSGDAPWKIW
nr:glucose-1-phosphate cytidylyltransferase [Butyrivibrio sp.]